MNRLIIIGNGFDLAHGLKSRFIDYLNHYTLEFIQKFFDCVNSKNPSYHGEITYGDLLMKFTIKPDNNILYQLKEITEFNDFFSLFQRPQSLTLKSLLLIKLQGQLLTKGNWVDIESLYFKTLYSITNNRNGGNKDGQIQKLNKEFKFIKNDFIKYLDLQLKKFNFNNKNDKHKNFINMYKDIFYDGFQIQSSKYNTMFLNFNYTNLLKKHIEIHGIRQPIINHIHGEISDEKNPIIMGFGDEHDEKFKSWDSNENYELFRYIKSANYYKTNNYKELSSFIEGGPFKLLVIGHSCGLSDRTLLREIFEHQSCFSIKLYYYQDKNGKTDDFERFVEVMRHFRNKAEVRKKVIYDEKNIMIQLQEIK